MTTKTKRKYKKIAKLFSIFSIIGWGILGIVSIAFIINRFTIDIDLSEYHGAEVYLCFMFFLMLIWIGVVIPKTKLREYKNKIIEYRQHRKFITALQYTRDGEFLLALTIVNDVGSKLSKYLLPLIAGGMIHSDNPKNKKLGMDELQHAYTFGVDYINTYLKYEMSCEINDR